MEHSQFPSVILAHMYSKHLEQTPQNTNAHSCLEVVNGKRKLQKKTNTNVLLKVTTQWCSKETQLCCKVSKCCRPMPALRGEIDMHSRARTGVRGRVETVVCRLNNGHLLHLKRPTTTLLNKDTPGGTWPATNRPASHNRSNHSDAQYGEAQPPFLPHFLFMLLNNNNNSSSLHLFGSGIIVSLLSAAMHREALSAVGTWRIWTARTLFD